MIETCAIQDKYLSWSKLLPHDVSQAGKELFLSSSSASSSSFELQKRKKKKPLGAEKEKQWLLWAVCESWLLYQSQG